MNDSFLNTVQDTSKPSKTLDEKILKMGQQRVDLRYGQSHYKVSWIVQTATVLSISLILFTNTYVSNYSFSKAEIEDLNSSPIETYSDFNLDLVQDKGLIESDLELLLSKDLNEK